MTGQVISDELAIRTLVHRYADAASRRDPLGVASTFTNDGEWHAPELGRFMGREAMLAFFTVDAGRLERVSPGPDVGRGRPGS